MLGYRFLPTDEELLILLRSWHDKQTSPVEPVIERHMYGANATPWILFKEDDPWQTEVVSGTLKKDSKVLYVITRLVRISNKVNSVRIAGCGTWDGQTGKSYIKKNGRKIGYKKMFNFRATSNTYGNWIMHEYHLDGDFLIGVSDDYVICRIKWVSSRTTSEEARCKTEIEASQFQECSNSLECTGRVQEPATARFQEKTCSGTSSWDLAVQSVAVADELPELVHVNGEENMTNSEEVFNGVQMYGQREDLGERIDFDDWEVEDLAQYFDEEQLSADCQGVQIQSDPIVPGLSNPNSTLVTQQEQVELPNSVDDQREIQLAGSESNPNLQDYEVLASGVSALQDYQLPALEVSAQETEVFSIYDDGLMRDSKVLVPEVSLEDMFSSYGNCFAKDSSVSHSVLEIPAQETGGCFGNSTNSECLGKRKIDFEDEIPAGKKVFTAMTNNLVPQSTFNV